MRKSLANRCHRTPRGSVRTLRSRHARGGNILVLLAILLPMLIGVIGLIIDGGMMMDSRRNLQHAADAAATAAATDLRLGKSVAAATATAEGMIATANSHPDATVAVHIPPTSGAYAGRSGYVEVEAETIHRPQFMPVLDGVLERPLDVRAVAGIDEVTADAAVVVLDPNPSEISVSPLPALTGLPALPTLTAGFEIEGLGSFSVDGAVLVNNAWGGVDENGDAVGSDAGPPYAVSCTPLLPLTRLRARDVRVVGGVDDPDNYSSFASGDPRPLQANRLPVPDPYASLPAPTTSSDPVNVSSVNRGAAVVTGLPLIGPPVNLQPGVYSYIRVVSGVANFAPGVYVIRGVDPVTQCSLCLLAGTVNANGVMFYVTNTASYDATMGAPDSGDGAAQPAAPGAMSLLPSVIIQASLLGSGISGLNAPSSPFNGLIIYQRRQDRRPIVIAHQNLLGSGQFAGTVYSKWGHVVFLGNGTYNARFVCGTLRVLTLFNSTLAPSSLLPAARDVLLVE